MKRAPAYSAPHFSNSPQKPRSTNQVQELRNYKESVCKLKDFPTLLTDNALAYEFRNNKNISELHCSNNLSEQELSTLTNVLETNKRLLTIVMGKKTLPSDDMGLTNQEKEISHHLRQNASMANPQSLVLLAPDSKIIVIDDPRLLLFTPYCSAIINHRNVAEIHVDQHLTHFYQVTRLSQIVSKNTNIVKISLHKFNEFGCDYEEESKSKLQGLKGSNNKFQDTIEMLFTSLRFNDSVADIINGEVTPLILPDNPTQEQFEAALRCLNPRHQVKELQLSSAKIELLQQLPQKCTLERVHFPCDLKSSHFKSITDFIRVNYKILEISYCEYANHTKTLSDMRYHNEKTNEITEELRANQFLSTISNPKTQILCIQKLHFNRQKAALLINTLQKYDALKEIHLEELSIDESDLFGLFYAFEQSCCTTLRSIIILKTPLSSRIIQKILDVAQKQPLLTVLHIVSSNMTDADIPPLAKWLKNNPPVSSISLHGNEIGNNGINSLCQALETNRRVSKLLLGGNPFDTTAIPAITRLLSQNSFITHLNLLSSCLLENDVKSFMSTLTKVNFSVVELEISHHTEKNSYRKGGYNTPLIVTAYKQRFLDMIAKFIARNADERDKLFIHVRRNEIADIQKLFQKKVSPLCSDVNGKTVLHVALEQPQLNLDLIECLIKSGCHPFMMDNAGIAPIDKITDETPELLVHLLQDPRNHFSPANPSTPRASDSKKRKIDIAPPSGNLKMDQFLTAKKPAQPETPKRHLEPSEQQAQEDSQVYSLTKAAKISPKLPEENPENQFSIFNKAYFAVKNHQTSQLQQCLKAMNPLHSYSDGNTLWHIAAASSATDCLHILYAYKEAANMSNVFRQLPLHLACLHIDAAGHTEMLELVLQANPNAVNALDEFNQSPLFCLTGGFIQSAYQAHVDRIRAFAATLLLSYGADPNHLVEDFNNQRHQVSILQKAISRGLYKLAKIIMNSPRCNLAHIDSEGWSALHYAVYFGQLEIIARLLIHPNVDINIINREGKTPRQMARDYQFASNIQNIAEFKQQIDALFETRNQQQLYPLASEVHWVNNLMIRFGCRYGRGHELILSFNEEHALLQNAVRKQMRGDGNYLSASLTFIVSKGEHQPGIDLPRVPIKVNLTFVPKFHATDAWKTEELIATSTFKQFKRSPGALERIIARFDAAPEDIKMTTTDHVNQAGLPLSKEGINALFQSTNSSADDHDFEKHFHHSEPALFDHLQQPHIINEISNTLQTDIQFVNGCKIYAVVLNAFSKNYLCPDCMVATMGFQNTAQGEFFKLLKSQLNFIGCVFPTKSPLRSITLFSAQQNYKQSRKSAEEHDNTVIDIRAYPNNQILSQDVTAIQPSSTIYTSRKY